MKKINDEYTFSEAVAKVMEERKRLNALLGDRSLDDFKLPDPAECLIEEVENEKKLFDKFNKLKTEHEEQGETLCKTRKKLAKKDKKFHKLSKENKKLNKQLAEEKAKNDNLTKENKTLKDKNKNLDKECKQLKKEKEPKLSLSHNQDTSHNHDTTLSNSFISSLAASYEKSEKEKEREHEKLVESNKKVLKLTEENKLLNEKVVESNKKVLKLAEEKETLNDKNKKLTDENEELKQKDAMRENQIESLIKYIKFLESRLNNQRNN